MLQKRYRYIQNFPRFVTETWDFFIASASIVVYNGGQLWGKMGHNGANCVHFSCISLIKWGKTVELMFLGQYSYTLDSKGRLTIPARFRKIINESVVVTRGLDRCLTVYPPAMWNEIAQKVNALPITDPRGRALRRIFFADAVNVELDRSGRILLPERLRAYAELQSSEDVVIVGLDRFLELWGISRWDAENAKQIEIIEQAPTLWENLQI